MEIIILGAKMKCSSNRFKMRKSHHNICVGDAEFCTMTNSHKIQQKEQMEIFVPGE